MVKPLNLTRHAITRMAQRNISISDLKTVVGKGIVIKEYPDDTPYPSKLVLGFLDLRPIHVVYSELETEILIISAYEPDPEMWESGFARRKK